MYGARTHSQAGGFTVLERDPQPGISQDIYGVRDGSGGWVKTFAGRTQVLRGGSHPYLPSSGLVRTLQSSKARLLTVGEGTQARGWESQGLGSGYARDTMACAHVLPGDSRQMALVILACLLASQKGKEDAGGGGHCTQKPRKAT